MPDKFTQTMENLEKIKTHIQICIMYGSYFLKKEKKECLNY